MLKLKKSVSILLVFIMVFSLFTIVPVTAGAAETDIAPVGDAVSYVKRSWNETTKQITETTETVENYIVLNNSDGVTLYTEWVVVDHDVTINGNIVIQDMVNLVICDGVTLTCKSIVCENSLIRIYGQANDSGKIIATANSTYAAGIGSVNEERSFGHVMIYGGTVNATGGEKGAGIGTASKGTSGYVSIFGGNVTATGGNRAAGIGGGYEGKLTNITIYGGTVNASSTKDGAGIGSGEDQSEVGTISIYGGTVTATTPNNAAAIGSGYTRDTMTGNINILGGTVNAWHTDNDANGSGIGASSMGFLAGGNMNGTIRISGGTVNARSFYGAGIGAGSSGSVDSNGVIAITGGVVRSLTGFNPGDDPDKPSTWSSSSNSFAIGGGHITLPGGSNFGTISVTGGKVYAFADKNGGAVNNNLIFGSNIRVSGGSDENIAYYQKDQRYDGVSHPCALIEECTDYDRSTCHYDENHPDTHSYDCNLCYAGYTAPHSFAAPTWTWGDDFSSATANFRCTECTCTKNTTASGDQITSEITKQPTYTQEGIRTYTATVEFNGADYTGSAEETIDKIPHSTGEVDYIKADGSSDSETAIVLLPDMTEFEAGWYAVTSDVTIDSRISCTGDVKLILCDGATLTAPKGIAVHKNNSLTIYEQSGKTGALVVTSPAEECAAIGASKNNDAGNITINGGNFNLTGGRVGAAIGGCKYQGGGTIVINGGKITANGGDFASGIGGAAYGNGFNVTINGGEIIANGGQYGAGIGSGYDEKSAIIIITGGTVTATGGDYSAGIGAGGSTRASADVRISGGNITATGGKHSSGSGKTSGIGNSSLSTTAVVSLSWTNASDSITANSYSGTVTIKKAFTDGTETINAGVVSDNGKLSGKTLTPARFMHHSLSLNGDIGVNYFVNLSADEKANSQVVFTWDGNSAQTKTLTVPFSEAKDTANGVRFTCPISAAEMNDSVTAQLYIGGELTETGIYSARQYSDVILTDAEWIAAYKAQEGEIKYNELATLVKSMLNYGAMAQIQFEHNVDKLANAGIDYDLVPLTESEKDSIPSILPKKENVDLSEYGLSYYGCSLLLKTKTTLRFYFEIVDEDKFNDEEVRLGDISGVKPYGNGLKYVYIEVVGIAANDLDQEYALSVGDTVIGEYSALSYVKDVLTDGITGAPLTDTVTALYRYHKAAKEFFAVPLPGADEIDIRNGL